MADPALWLINDVARGKFQLTGPGLAGPDHCQRLPVWSPVRPQDVIQHFSRGTTSEGNASQGARLGKGAKVYRVQRYRHLTFRGDGKNLSVGKSDGSRV